MIVPFNKQDSAPASMDQPSPINVLMAMAEMQKQRSTQGWGERGYKGPLPINVYGAQNIQEGDPKPGFPKAPNIKFSPEGNWKAR